MADTESLERLRSVSINSATKREFTEGDLAGRLRDKYPELFDDEDLELAQPDSQPRLLVKNWMAAIDLFQRKGWASLQDPYFKPKHAAKHEKMREILPADVADLISRDGAAKKALEPPNLLVFREGDDGETEWRFAHVVSGTPGSQSRLGAGKMELFEKLVELAGQPIWIIPFRVGVTESPLRFDRLLPQE